MRCLTLLLGLLLSTAALHAERLVLVAGGETETTKLREPFAIAFDPKGALHLVEMESGNRLLKVGAKGELQVLAGNGKGFAGDGGPVAQAQFSGPHNLVISPAGEIYIADTWNCRVRHVDAGTGVVTTLAGTGQKGYSGDGGLAASAQFGSVIQIALDPAGKRLYVADIENRRVRRIDFASGTVEAVAGNGQKGVPRDGDPAAQAPLLDPRAVAVAADGSFYVLERNGHSLRFVDAQGRISTVAGTGKAGATGDGGPAKEATMNGPKYLSLDTDGSVLIADTENHAIRRYVPKTGRMERVAGSGRKGAAGLDGPPEAAELNRPHAVLRGPDGLIYIADSYNGRILKIAP